MRDLLGSVPIVHDQIRRANDVRELRSVERRVLILEPHGPLLRTGWQRLLTTCSPRGMHATPLLEVVLLRRDRPPYSQTRSSTKVHLEMALSPKRLLTQPVTA